ncbi:MAG: hypothetical protein GF315_03850 [candidate division Zixibacteria bacterium]|nr:hypothetical protein [candidate division Zixibacteria bacterium]
MTLSVAIHAMELNGGSRQSHKLSGNKTGGIRRTAEPESIENYGYGEPTPKENRFHASQTSAGDKAVKESPKDSRTGTNCKQNQHPSQIGKPVTPDIWQSSNPSHKNGKGDTGISSIRNNSASNQQINQLTTLSQKAAGKLLNSIGNGRMAGMKIGFNNEPGNLKASVDWKLLLANLEPGDNRNGRVRLSPNATANTSKSENGNPIAVRETTKDNENPNTSAREDIRSVGNRRGEIRKLDFRWLIPKTELKDGGFEFGSKQSSMNQALSNNSSAPDTIRQNWVKFAIFDQFYIKGEGRWEINQFNRYSQLQINNSSVKSKVEPNEPIKAERANEQPKESGKSATVNKSASAKTYHTKKESRTDKGDKSALREHKKSSNSDKRSSRAKNSSEPFRKSDSAQKAKGENRTQAKLTGTSPTGSKLGNLSTSFASMFDAKSSALNDSVLKQLPSEISRIVISSINSETKLAGRILRLNLYPPELGSIDLRFYEVNKRISVRVLMESEAVYKLLSSNVDDLKEALRSAGVNIDKMEFSFAQKGSFNPEDFEQNSELLDKQNQLANGSSKDSNRDGTEDSAARTTLEQEFAEREDLYVSVNGVNWLA